MADAHHIFNRSRVRKHRDRAAAGFAAHDFLLREMASRLADRLQDFGRHFPRVLDLGAHTGLMAEYLEADLLVQADLSQKMIAPAKGLRLVASEECLPFAESSFDLILSAGSLHWVNDLPGALIQIRRALKPGGLFLAVVPGGRTLQELRRSFEQAEIDISGGVSPRVSPFLDARDGASLLQRAGFAEPVADSELLTVTYAHPLKLMRELRGMGETSALIESRKGFTPCSLLMMAVDVYLRDYSDDKGRIPATFELVTFTGWRP